MIKNISTICSFCNTGCGMFVRLNGEEAVGILPNTRHPVNEGRLCKRGWNRYQNLRSENRLSHPLVRKGSKLEEVGWDEALQISKEKISYILSRYGPQAIGVVGSPWLTNEDNYRVSLFCRQVLKSNNLDGSYRFSGAAALTALNETWSGALGSLASIQSLRESPAILVLGRESLRDFSPVGARMIQAYQQGSKLILADLVCLRAEHFYNTFLPFPEEQLAQILKEKKDVAEQIPRLLAQPGSAIVFIADQIKTASSLLSLLSFMSQDQADPHPIPMMIPLSRSPNFRGAWDMGIRPNNGGLTLLEMLDLSNVIKGLLVFGDDLLTHLPSFSLMEKLKKLDFLLVADRFLTDTVQIAHGAFPIPLLAESTGTLTNCEGRVQKLRPVLNTGGESRPLSYLLSSLTRKLGSSLPAHSDKEMRKEISLVIPQYQNIHSEPEWDSPQGIVLSTLKHPVIPSIPFETREGPQAPGKYHLFIPNTLYAWSRNQMILESPLLRIEYPEDRMALRMNRQDVRELRIRPGEKIKVCSDHGEAQLAGEIDESLPSRTLVLPMHFSTVIENLAGKRKFDHIANYSYCPDLEVTLKKV